MSLVRRLLQNKVVILAKYIWILQFHDYPYYEIL